MVAIEKFVRDVMQLDQPQVTHSTSRELGVDPWSGEATNDVNADPGHTGEAIVARTQ